MTQQFPAAVYKLGINPCNVRVVWELLTPSRQKEVLRYLNFAKRPETLWSNIKKVIALLQKKLPPRGRRAGIRVRV